LLHPLLRVLEEKKGRGGGLLSWVEGGASRPTAEGDSTGFFYKKVFFSPQTEGWFFFVGHKKGGNHIPLAKRKVLFLF